MDKHESDHFRLSNLTAATYTKSQYVESISKAEVVKKKKKKIVSPKVSLYFPPEHPKLLSPVKTCHAKKYHLYQLQRDAGLRCSIHREAPQGDRRKIVFRESKEHMKTLSTAWRRTRSPVTTCRLPDSAGRLCRRMLQRRPIAACLFCGRSIIVTS